MVCEQSQFLFIELTVSADHMRLLRVLEGEWSCSSLYFPSGQRVTGVQLPNYQKCALVTHLRPQVEGNSGTLVQPEFRTLGQDRR